MSKPRYPWWGYVKALIREYPRMREGVFRNGYSGIDLEAVEKAVADTEKLLNGEDILKIIDLVYWSHTRTLDGAAIAVHCSYSTAQHWNANFIKLVAQKKGLI